MLGNIKKECQKAYGNGYYVGWDTAMRLNGESVICTLAYKYHKDKPSGSRMEYVGVGNEEYSEDLERLTGRSNGKYWWAKSIKGEK